MCDAVLASRSAVGEDPARGRVRRLKGYRVEVNGRVYARLAANKTNITLKKCKSGMKYTCVVVVMTCPEKSGGHQRKVRTTANLLIQVNFFSFSFFFFSCKTGKIKWVRVSVMYFLLRAKLLIRL